MTTGVCWSDENDELISFAGILFMGLKRELVECDICAWSFLEITQFVPIVGDRQTAAIASQGEERQGKRQEQAHCLLFSLFH